MEELENQVTEQETAGQESVVGSQQEDVTNPGQAAGEGGNAGPASQHQQGGQSHQDNAAAKAARIRAEQMTREEMKRQYDSQIAKLGIINPYTGKPMASMDDLTEYGSRYNADKMEQEAKRKGTTVQQLQEDRENREWIAKKREEDKKQESAKKAIEERKRFLIADLEKFTEKFPDVDAAKLENNQKFRRFAGSRMYREPLADLYTDFVDMVSEAERSAVERASSKASRSTGGGQSGGGDGLTPSQRADLEEWNRNNPSMKMTAKEFLSM